MANITLEMFYRADQELQATRGRREKRAWLSMARRASLAETDLLASQAPLVISWTDLMA